MSSVMALRISSSSSISSTRPRSAGTSVAPPSRRLHRATNTASTAGPCGCSAALNAAVAFASPARMPAPADGAMAMPAATYESDVGGCLNVRRLSTRRATRT